MCIYLVYKHAVQIDLVWTTIILDNDDALRILVPVLDVVHVAEMVNEIKKNGATSNQQSRSKKPIESTDDAESDSQKVPIVVAVMLIVPIVCVLLILLGFKIYNMSELDSSSHVCVLRNG